MYSGQVKLGRKKIQTNQYKMGWIGSDFSIFTTPLEHPRVGPGPVLGVGYSFFFSLFFFLVVFFFPGGGVEFGTPATFSQFYSLTLTCNNKM